MALTAKVVTFNIGTGAVSSTVTVSGVGFTPTAVILWWSGRTDSTDTVGRRSIMYGIGFATGATQRNCATVTSEDAIANSDTYKTNRSDACIAAITVTGAVDGLADFTSFNGDGFVLTIDDQFTTDLRVSALCIGGTTNALTIDFTTGTATGNRDITTIGFQGDAALFVMAGAFGTISSNAKLSLGAAVSSTQQFTTAYVAEDAAGNANTNAYHYSGECFTSCASTGAPSIRASFVSWLSNGFRVNMLENTGASDDPVFCLVLQGGGSYAVGNLLTQTDTTTDIVETGFGFTPVAALFASCCVAESTQDTAAAHGELSVGAFDGVTSRAAQALIDEDAVGTMETTTAVEFDEVYANISTASAIEGLMDIKSIDSDGFTCIMDDADPAQAFVGYLAFGNAVPATYRYTYGQAQYNTNLRM